MEIFKRLVLFSVATIAAVFLIIWSVDAFGFRSPIFAFLVNWIAMSWVAILGQVVHFSFPTGYYNIKAFERTGRVYERLGIRFFKRLVRCGPLSIFSPTLRLPQNKTISALQLLDHQMQSAETGHVLIFYTDVTVHRLCFTKGLVRRRRMDAGVQRHDQRLSNHASKI